jgi:hypothetical protein
VASRRYFLTIPAPDAERLEAYAASVERRPTTAAAELLLAGLNSATSDAAQVLADARRRIEELERQLDAILSAEHPPDPGEVPPDGPRWRWQIGELLADAEWWDRWLPSLYELLGRDLRADGGRARGGGQPVVDSRGYSDLLEYLFPPTGGVTWRSPDYPAAAAAAADDAQEGMPPSVRHYAWEPVLRHVAAALCALEHAAENQGNPQLHLDAVDPDHPQLAPGAQEPGRPGAGQRPGRTADPLSEGRPPVTLGRN